MTLNSLMLAAALLVAAPQDNKAQDAKPETVSAETAAVVREQLPSYPLTTCLVSGEEIGSMGDAIEHVVEGRLVRLCCKGCVKKVDADPKAAIAKVDAAVIKAQKASYPLETCAISGEELGEDAVDVVVGTRLVRVCCGGCVKKADTEAVKAKVDAAYIKAQLASYTLTTCAISGEDLGDEPVDMLYGTRLVRLCCKGCVKGVYKDPVVVLAKLDGASKTTVKKK